MERSFDLSIPKPCHENWNNFHQTSQGGFCSQCQKEVIDFTTWTEDQIKAYFVQHAGTTCGRFKKIQLKNYTIQKPRSRSPWQTWPVPVLGLSLLLWTSEAEAQQHPADTTEHVMRLGEVAAMQVSHTPPAVITGKIISSEDNMPFPGVRVTLKGTSLETTTDINGMFSLIVANSSPSDAVIAQFVGYKEQEVSIAHLNTITMKLDDTFLGEIVIERRWTPRVMWWKIKKLFSVG